MLTVTNQPPVADAGPDQTVTDRESLMLDGTGSSDPEGGVLTYAWTLDGVEIATGPQPRFGPLAAGTYTVSLTVTDTAGASAVDALVLTVIPSFNQPPIARAGDDIATGFTDLKAKSALVTLDGSASLDPDGTIVSYLWARDGVTVGTAATVQIELGKGSHSFTLTVTDNEGAQASDQVAVTVKKDLPVPGS